MKEVTYVGNLPQGELVLPEGSRIVKQGESIQVTDQVASELLGQSCWKETSGKTTQKKEGE